MMVDITAKSRHNRHHRRRHRFRIIRGGNMTSSMIGLLLTLLVMIFTSYIDLSRHSCYYCDALKFGFGGNNNKNKKDDDHNKKKEDDDMKRAPTPSTSTTPTTVLETEARTARELSKSISTLQKQLSTCNDRISSITSAFQNLYSLHLKHIDGLRKCKEGMISGRDLQDLLDATPTVDAVGGGATATTGDGATTTKKGQKEISKTFQALLNQAHTTELHNQRTIQNEEIATKHKQLITKLESQIHQLKLRETAWERTISELVARKDILERRETAWTRTISELMVDIEIRNKRENWWSVMRDEMESRIGGLSYMAVLERYGPGPHIVSMIVELDNNQHEEILIELANPKLMPHSVHIFLSQISAGYWSRGTPAIVMNPGHVLQACPHPCLETKALGGSYPGDPYVDMKHVGLDAVSFQEYHPNYPHEKYTVGFAGRPGGPEFYFNLMNNTLDHGPAEIRKMALEEGSIGDNDNDDNGDDEEMVLVEPDPCFGKVIKGFEVIDKISEEHITRADLPEEAKESRGNGGDDDDDVLSDSLLVQPVRIVSMSIVSEDDTSKEEETRDEL